MGSALGFIGEDGCKGSAVRLLGDVGLTILTRILGLLVAAIGVQFVLTGLTNVIVHTIAPAVLTLH